MPGTRGDPRQFTAEDVFLIFVVISCLTGAVAITIITRAVPQAVIAVLLSAGLSALVYRFLGGIKPQDASVGFGVFKAGGSLGALVGLIYFLNPMLERQMTDPAGESPLAVLTRHNWGWQYAEQNWRGEMQFSVTDDAETFAVEGAVRESRIDDNGAKRVRVVRRFLPGSHATFDGEGLLLDLDVEEVNGRRVKWQSLGPFVERRFLVGTIKVRHEDGVGHDYTSNIFLMR